MKRRLLPLFLLCGPAVASPDGDGDGLSDLEERHKYLTDPERADTDGDGTPDGDWNERREYAYSIRLVVRVLRPAAAVCDAYQDARVVDEGDHHVTLEVISYPLGTAGDAGSAGSRPGRAGLSEHLRPGPTSNWNAKMRAELVAALEKDGIEVRSAGDTQLAERAAAWLMKHARFDPGHFTTFFTEFAGGRPRIRPGLEKVVHGYAAPGLPLEEQWKRDLFARGMFESRERGSCTSSAIYLAGCLRALDLPTRILYCIPPADATDPAQIALVRKGITHHRVRRTLLVALGGLSGWSSHTMNEVFAGGRWLRLNYERLAQPALDERNMGLLIPVLRLHDWADAKMAATVGRRQGLEERDNLFPHLNPYVTVEISDRFGAHAKVENEPVGGPEELGRLTIVKVFWYRDRPRGRDLDRLDEKSGHVLFQVKEEGTMAEYKPFYDAAGKEFALQASGHPDVVARAERGYWASDAGEPGTFYLRIEAESLARMVEDVSYTLVPRNRGDRPWVVADGVRLVRSGKRGAR